MRALMRRVIAGALFCAASGCFGTQDFGVGELALDADMVPTGTVNEDGSRGAPPDAALPPREENEREDDDDNRNLVVFDAAMNAPTDAGALSDAADTGRDGAADAAADAARDAALDGSADASRDASSDAGDDGTMDAARNPLCVIEPWHCL